MVSLIEQIEKMNMTVEEKWEQLKKHSPETFEFYKLRKRKKNEHF
jgi:hypothetical protein